MMKTLLAVVCFSVLLAPAPWGIALNHETQECGGYWAGDEYGSSELPPGWVDFYPDFEGTIETDIGSCSFGRGPSGDAESCCQELGYTYAGPSIGKASISPLMGFFLGSFACAGLAILLVIGLVIALVVGGGIFLWRRRRRTQ
jgi:hypothetical protein